jgi:hypothetical protein
MWSLRTTNKSKSTSLFEFIYLNWTMRRKKSLWSNKTFRLTPTLLFSQLLFIELDFEKKKKELVVVKKTRKVWTLSLPGYSSFYILSIFMPLNCWFWGSSGGLALEHSSFPNQYFCALWCCPKLISYHYKKTKIVLKQPLKASRNWWDIIIDYMKEIATSLMKI